MKIFAILLAAVTLAACSDRQPAANTPAPTADGVGALPARSDGKAGIDTATNASAVTPPPAPDAANTAADYLGRWNGVEGMYLVVAAKPGGGVTLEMQWDLDHQGMFDGSITAEGLRFMRDGIAESANHTNGDATGLKYLAGKKDCLTVKPGEGYCRN